jgi:hypothetical protein
VKELITLSKDNFAVYPIGLGSGINENEIIEMGKIGKGIY